MDDYLDEVNIDIRARAILSERIGNQGALMIWPEQPRAYLDDPGDYPRAAAALGCDQDEVDDALWRAYKEAYAQAERE